MQLYYYRSPSGNFGDDLNTWLWTRLLPPDCWDPSDGIRFAGIGTILTDKMPAAQRWIVLGSGAGYGPPPAGFGGSAWRILCVRGPLSARVLGLPPDAAVTDGAYLLNRLPEFEPLPEAEREGVVFVPHHNAFEAGDWAGACARAGLTFLDPRGDAAQIIQSIRRARLVVADAMHAAIIADALRVPWVPVATSPEINTFKWLDWTRSVETAYEPSPLPASTLLEAMRGAVLALHGERYRVVPPTLERVIRHYEETRALKAKPWWPPVQRLGARFYSSGVTRIERGLRRASVARDADDRRLDRAAAALRQAAARPPYLSADAVWRRRNDQLAEHLDTLAALARPTGHPGRPTPERLSA